MDKFTIASKTERFHLTQIEYLFTNSTIQYTPDTGFDVYDAIITTKTKKYILEAKCRDASYQPIADYSNKIYDSVMLECKKWRDLKEAAKELDSDILFISFAFNTTIIFNITKLMQTNPELFGSCSYTKCPLQTMGNSKKVKKPVFYLPLNLGKIIDYRIK